jgi:hypothetical protein
LRHGVRAVSLLQHAGCSQSNTECRICSGAPRERKTPARQRRVVGLESCHFCHDVANGDGDAYGYYPAYSYGYTYPAYSYGHAYPAYSYGYAYPAYSYGYGGYYSGYRPYYRPALYGGYRVARRVAIHRSCGLASQIATRTRSKRSGGSTCTR